MKAVFFFALVASLALVSASNVADLNADTFDEHIKIADVTLVEFFAPWCGHCKALAPEYETAADELVGNDKVSLAKVDCTEHKDLCSRFGVRGFPTLKVFSNDGGEPTDYDAARKAPAIVSFMKKQTQPAVTKLADAAAADALAEGDELVVIFYNNGDADASASFAKLASSNRNEYTFGEVETSSDGPSLALFRKFDTPKVTYTGDLSSNSDIVAFLKSNSFPSFGTIGPDNFQKYLERGFPLVWHFIDLAKEAETTDLVSPVAQASEGLSFVKLDGERWKEHGKTFGCTGTLPCVVIEDREAGSNFLFTEELTAESLTKFVADWKDGNLSAHLRSQDPPASNDAPVTVIVGSTWEEIVMDETKDVLVEFYAPWCGHCKSLAPKYDLLGEEFSNQPNVVIAKIDATENDSPIKVSGFPTLKFFPAGDKSNVVAYSGDRSQEDLSKFIRENAKAMVEETETKSEGHDEL